MKTSKHFLSYLAQFFLEREMFQTKIVEKTKTRISCSIIFFFENCAFVKLYEKNIIQLDWPQMAIWQMRFACWMTKATNTHSGFVILIVFHDNDGYLKALQCYVVRTLPVVLKYSSISTRPSVWFPFFKCYNK